MELLNTKDRNPNTKIQEKKKEEKQENHKLKDIYRIIISKEAKVALDSLLMRANDGFEAGEITKSDIVNALLANAGKYFSDAEMKLLRAQHFDETKVLGALLKDASNGGEIPEKLKTFLRSQYGLLESRKKKPTNGEV
jgi:hypothetical protein